MAELCQGNLIPTPADKMVPSGAAQITTWRLATVQALEKVTVGWNGCVRNLLGRVRSSGTQGVCKMSPLHQPGGLAIETTESCPGNGPCWSLVCTCATSADRRQKLLAATALQALVPACVVAGEA